ncbi:MAG: hypothetical protein LBF40_10590 [Deltaproteobacteria bacterium]|jgi:uncharacterized membrane protein YjjP (DUF1212 family)|nr:hypothetical protein [Deltaproteobacteria bacterium]
MALTKKEFLLSAFCFLMGLALAELGVLSAYVALAYSAASGSFVAALAGALLMLVGGLLIVRAKRGLSPKE